MIPQLVTVLCFLGQQVFTVTMASEYHATRARIIQRERELALGGDIHLTPIEETCNEKLLKMKRRELYDSNYQPWTKNFLSVREYIENSEVFRFIKKVPKGGSLHSHLYASASYNYTVNDLLTEDNLYVCELDGKTKLKFLRDNVSNPNCELLADKRKMDDFANWLDAHLLVANVADGNVNVWDSFRKIFTFTYDLYSYIDVLKKYINRVLLEHYADNVTYVEVRSPFVPMYDLNGTIYEPVDFVEILWKSAEDFKKEHPDFIGMKLIYAQYRGTDVETIKENLNKLKIVMRKFPNFVAGVDFVGFEEEATLSSFIEELKGAAADLNFYFHAGETNRQGAPVDLNLIDAVIFNSKRIGHAYALPKHPYLMEKTKTQNIAIEVCPISNQVLGLVTDLRNHPAAYLIAHGYPMVICNDDPGNWGAEGLSYDWYLAFMAMSGENCGLELLKKFAMNSLQYSALNKEEKRTALDSWNKKWIKFVEDVNNEI